MATNSIRRYLLHFAHEHLTFRWTEFLSLTSLHNCRFKLITKQEHLQSQPYIIIELDDALQEERLVKSAKQSYLLKDLYELWAQSSSSIENLVEEVNKSYHFLSGLYSEPGQDFRVNCGSFGNKLSHETRLEWIEKLTFMETFQSRPNLTSPKQVYCVFELINSEAKNSTKEYFFCRHLTTSDREKVLKFNLKERKFIANTSMDPLLSLIAANSAKVKQNDVVYDPFVGSGGLLIAAAYKGAYVLGSDIDWQLLHGRSKPSRKGQEIRAHGESVRMNLQQYNLESYYLDVMVSDVTRSPLKESIIVDAIISDPPYGIREASERLGPRNGKKIIRKHAVSYPSKTSYDIRELLQDLLNLSAKHLRIEGRLVYYLPIMKTKSSQLMDNIPTHPCMKMISYCEQDLNYKASRLMVVLEKIRDPTPDDRVEIPVTLNGVKFRETYFGSKSEH